MKRDFVAVVEMVKKSLPSHLLVPEMKPLKIELIKLQIRAKNTSARYGHQDLWERGAVLLGEFLGELDQEWKKKTYALWAKRR